MKEMNETQYEDALADMQIAYYLPKSNLRFTRYDS